jgi:hypothetical protein
MLGKYRGSPFHWGHRVHGCYWSDGISWVIVMIKLDDDDANNNNTKNRPMIKNNLQQYNPYYFILHWMPE